MFDVIGKRRIFYIISLALTIPGVVFILLTPFTDAGLQFTIDFTGGTRWELKFEDASVTPEQVEVVFAANDLEASAIRTGTGYIEIKTEPIVLQPAPAPSGTVSVTRNDPSFLVLPASTVMEGLSHVMKTLVWGAKF